MGNRDTFALYITHGGKFIEYRGRGLYIKGDIFTKHHCDVDRFGYFDLEDVIKGLGYESWLKLCYRIPSSENYRSLKNDQDILNMLSYLTLTCRHANIYVDGGIKIGDSAPVVLEDLSAAELDELYAEDPFCRLQEDIAEVYDGLEHVSAKWKGKHNKITEKGKGKKGEPTTDEIRTEPNTIELTLDNFYDELFEDSLSDNELGFDDEEYVMSRRNVRIDKAYFNDIGKFVGVEVVPDEHIVFEFDYDDSDTEVNSDIDDDDRKRKKVTYDPKCDHNTLELKLGMRFESGIQCKKAFTNKAIAEKWEIHFSRVCRERCEAKCTPPCPWRCYGSMVKGDETFIIKVLEEPHNCHRTMKNLLVSSKWIAKQYLNDFRVKHNFTVADLKSDLMERFKLDVGNNRLYKARTIALDTLQGTVAEHYAKLRRYIAEMKKVDREGRFELLLGQESVFKRIYVGFSSLKKGFINGCRPIIGLDGYHLKTHIGGVLLCAIGKDGNDQMFPIAWAIVEVENIEYWTWFIKILMEELEMDNGLGITFISDQQKGLIHAVSTLAPLAKHRNCARHVYANWKKQHKGITLKNMFWNAIRATYAEQYQLVIEEIKSEKPAAYEDFIERGHKNFVRLF